MSSAQSPPDPGFEDAPAGFRCVSYAEDSGVVRLRLTGELDLATAPQLAHALGEIADPAVLVILDLSELTFLDSSGLHMIVSARARMADAGRRLVLVPGCHQVQRLFELTGTVHRLEFVNTTRGSAASSRSSRGDRDKGRQAQSDQGAHVMSPLGWPPARRWRIASITALERK